MSQKFMAGNQIVGYNFDKKQLLVTLTEQIAKKMKADGWDVVYDEKAGWVIAVGLEESPA